MELSKRLYAVAGFVTDNNRVADVGCDHGYIPIYLIQNHISPYVIAMDVHKGPLARAEANIKAHALSDYIETRLSDGMEALQHREVDTLICAGMGGRLVIKILEEGKHLLPDMKELILQPQSDIALVRIYLKEHAYTITGEDIVFEDGKYYQVMKAVHGKDTESNLLYGRYGKLLLMERNPVLLSYLKKEHTKILDMLLLLKEKQETSQKSKARITELEKELLSNKEALSYFWDKFT